MSIITNSVKSQNIFSALHLNENREYKTKRPIKIIETNIFYNTSGKEVVKNIKDFDEEGLLLKEERFDDYEKLNARLTYTYDKINRIKLTRTIVRWNPYGVSIETAFYTYDSNNYLINITDKNSKGSVIRISDLICNEKGHPIQLSLFDRDGKSFGKEIANYHYEKNKVVTSVISNQGDTLSTDTSKISFTNASLFPNEGESYNENGDLLNWTSKNYKGELTIFENDYIYDNFSNCVESKIYKVTIDDNGKRKRKIDKISKTKFIYQK